MSLITRNVNNVVRRIFKCGRLENKYVISKHEIEKKTLCSLIVMVTFVNSSVHL